MAQPARPETKQAGSLVTTALAKTSSIEPGVRTLQRGGYVWFAVAAVLIPLAYALYTEQIWEDYFITFRYSENLCAGKGLVYHDGERLHGFTSPLGVLLPALSHALAGQPDSYVPALWLFRVLSILAFAGGGVLLVRSVPADRESSLLIQVTLALLYLLEAKSVAFSVNGMETGFMLLFLAWGVYEFSRDDSQRWLARGGCWAGLMWTRPDGFLYIAVLALGSLLFTGRPRRAVFFTLLKSAGVCTVLYLPWFVWAWSYYGTPVPHTVVAKSNLEEGHGPQLLRTLQTLPTHYPQVAAKLFQPTYAGMWDASWHPGLTMLCLFLGLACAVYWAIPVRDRLGRMASLGFALLCFYLAFLRDAYPWYLPPVTMLGLVVLASGTFVLAEAFTARTHWAGPLAVLALLAFCLERGYVLGLLALQERIQEEEIELGNRREIGLWLKAHMQPGESVYLEPIGYVGYFSQARICDWPGLVCPEVVRLRKEKKLDLFTVPSELKPDWVVLRFHEADLMAEEKYFARDYELVQVFDATPRLEAYRYIPGKSRLDFDAGFKVYKRRSTRGD